MSDLTVRVPTRFRSMQEARPHLETAIGEQFPGGILHSRWEGDVLHISGFGARGTLVLEGGEMVGRAELKPPASLMREIVEEKIRTAMESAVG